jgi:uncharacterized protein
LWLLLLLSIGGLLLGPALVAMGRGRRTLAAAVDGLTLGVLPMLVLTRLLPHTMESLRGWAVAIAVVGFVAVSFAHRGGHGLEARIGRAVVVPTLFLHALADGAGLAIAAHSKNTGWLLGAALVLHRLPEGLFVATALAPPSIETNIKRTLVPVAILAAGTIVGALSGHTALAMLPESLIDGVVAFGLGAMLRLVLHTHAPPHDTRGRAASGIAFIVGIALVLLLPDPLGILTKAQPRELSLVQSVGPLFVETAPAFLIGLIATGAMHGFLPRRVSGWLRGGGAPSQAVRGVAFGLPLPICSCGVVPVARKLFVLGVPAAAVVAFAIATPEIGVDSALLSFRLLGVPLTLARIAASAVLAFVVGIVVSRFVAPADESSFASFGPPPDEDVAGARPPTTRERLRVAARDGLVDGLDHLGAWYVVGILVAAVFEASVDPSIAARLPKPFDMFASVALAIPVYVCAQGGTPIAAMMIHKGFSTAAALSLLLVGPATNLPILAVLRRELGTRAAAAFALTSIAIAMTIALLVDRLIPTASVPAIHPLVAHDHHVLEWLAAAAVVLMLFSSIVRMGPRGWFAAMAIDSHEEHVHEHGCGHDHDGHDHALT